MVNFIYCNHHIPITYPPPSLFLPHHLIPSLKNSLFAWIHSFDHYEMFQHFCVTPKKFQNLHHLFFYIYTFSWQVKNPQRDLPLGIALALLICCILYMLVSVIIVGLVPYYDLDPDTPISSAFASYGVQWAV